MEFRCFKRFRVGIHFGFFDDYLIHGFQRVSVFRRNAAESDAERYDVILDGRRRRHVRQSRIWQVMRLMVKSGDGKRFAVEQLGSSAAVVLLVRRGGKRRI